MNPVITCDNCGAKLRVKATTLRTVTGITCTKCTSRIPIPRELKEQTKGSQGDTPVPATMSEPAPKARSISFACDKCGKNMVVRADLEGKHIRCNTCKDVTVVSAPDAEAKASAHPAPPHVPSKAPEEEKQEKSEQAPTSLVSEPPPTPTLDDMPKVDEKRIVALEKEVVSLKDQLATLTRLFTRYADSNSDASSILADALKGQAD